MALTNYFKKKLTAMIEQAKNGIYNVHVFNPVAISTCPGPLLSIVVFDPQNNKQLYNDLQKVASAFSANSPSIYQTWYSYAMEFEITA